MLLLMRLVLRLIWIDRLFRMTMLGLYEHIYGSMHGKVGFTLLSHGDG